MPRAWNQRTSAVQMDTHFETLSRNHEINGYAVTVTSSANATTIGGGVTSLGGLVTSDAVLNPA